MAIRKETAEQRSERIEREHREMSDALKKIKRTTKYAARGSIASDRAYCIATTTLVRLNIMKPGEE